MKPLLSLTADTLGVAGVVALAVLASAWCLLADKGGRRWGR